MRCRKPAGVLSVLFVALLIAGCTRERAGVARPPGSAQAPLLDGLGNHHHAITTRSQLAQRYFDQGLRLMFAYNTDEAHRSFEEASRQDPSSAMAYWGIALSLGPNINEPPPVPLRVLSRIVGDSQGSPEPAKMRAARQAIQTALLLSGDASERERAYIAALATRYSDPQVETADRGISYANAMREVWRRYPDDLDAATLFAEALMNLRPWNLWTTDGLPQPGTVEIVQTLELVLERNPNHPGANHYYIHAVEASLHPESALAAAQRLDGLMPGVGHMVHMPSHIYVRVGQYAEATEANRRAIAVDRAYFQAAEPAEHGAYRMMYYPHNLHFLSYSASVEGRSADALQASRELGPLADPSHVGMMPMIELLVPVRWLTSVRFGHWDDVLGAAAPPAWQRYATGMWHFARGMAFANMAQPGEARTELEQLEAILPTIPSDAMAGLNIASTPLSIARYMLAGEIAAREGDTGEAVRLYYSAALTSDRLRYDEPPDWLLSPRQYLGALLLDSGRPSEAERVYRDDLRREPENGWSLFGLTRALRAQDREDEAREAERRFRLAWRRADVRLQRSRL